MYEARRASRRWTPQPFDGSVPRGRLVEVLAEMRKAVARALEAHQALDDLTAYEQVLVVVEAREQGLLGAAGRRR